MAVTLKYFLRGESASGMDDHIKLCVHVFDDLEVEHE
jgi:hypothetical protein